MAKYLVTLLDPDGHHHATYERDHPSDDEAIDAAGRLHHRHGIEVWDEERLVARFPPLDA